MLYINVIDVADSGGAVESAGRSIVQEVGGDPGKLTARFRGPYGNWLALYQETVA